MVFLPALVEEAWFQGSRPIPESFLGMEPGLQCSDSPWGCRRDRALSLLAQGADENGGIVWISGWKLLKAVTGTHARQGCRESTDQQGGGARLCAEECHTVSKPLRSRGEAPRETKI